MEPILDDTSLQQAPAADATVTAPASPAPVRFESIPCRLIERSETNPRKHFDEKSLEELAASVRQLGILQPILVRPRSPKGYILVAGERRFRAALRAGLVEIPAVVREMSDTDALELDISEGTLKLHLAGMSERLKLRSPQRSNFSVRLRMTALLARGLR